MVGILAGLVQGNPANSSTLNDLKTVADIVGTLVTALAVIVGAVWAYYRFVRGRTYRPRLEVSMAGQWLADASRLLLARVRVKNIGASKVQLLQKGTGLRVSSLAESEASGSATWESGSVYPIFEEHAWVEPGETVSDDVLLRLNVADGQPVLFETRLVCETRPAWKRWGRNITVFARQVVPDNATLPSAADG